MRGRKTKCKRERGLRQLEKVELLITIKTLEPSLWSPHSGANSEYKKRVRPDDQAARRMCLYSHTPEYVDAKTKSKRECGLSERFLLTRPAKDAKEKEDGPQTARQRSGPWRDG